MPEIPTSIKTLEEIEASQRQFYAQKEDGSIVYNNDGLLATLKSQRDSENKAKAELEVTKAELELLKNVDVKVDDKKEVPKPTDNKELLELKKQVEEMRQANQEAVQKNKTLLADQLKQESAKKAGMDEALYAIFDSNIGHDEKGLFVLDIDGTAKLNPLTGVRVLVEDFYKEKIKENPKFAKEGGQGANFRGNGLRGMINNNQVNAKQHTEMKAQYNKAMMSGNSKVMEKIEENAMMLGIKLI